MVLEILVLTGDQGMKHAHLGPGKDHWDRPASAESQGSEHAIAKSPNSLFKKAVCSSSVITAPLLVQCWPGWSMEREQAEWARGHAVLMMDRQAFDPTGITASPRRVFYGFCSPITNLTLTSTWGITASEFPKGTPVLISSTRILSHSEPIPFFLSKTAVSLVLWCCILLSIVKKVPNIMILPLNLLHSYNERKFVNPKSCFPLHCSLPM